MHQSSWNISRSSSRRGISAILFMSVEVKLFMLEHKSSEAFLPPEVLNFSERIGSRSRYEWSTKMFRHCQFRATKTVQNLLCTCKRETYLLLRKDRNLGVIVVPHILYMDHEQDVYLSCISLYLRDHTASSLHVQ